MTNPIKFDCRYVQEEGTLIFKLSVLGIKFKFTISDPTTATKKQWSDFISSYEEKSIAIINLNQSDEYLELKNEGFYTTFLMGTVFQEKSEVMIPNSIAEKVVRKAFGLLTKSLILWK